MGTPRKINAILLNIKINRQKLVSMCRYELTTCWQNFMEKYLTWVKISQKVLGGLLFFDSHRSCCCAESSGGVPLQTIIIVVCVCGAVIIILIILIIVYCRCRHSNSQFVLSFTSLLSCLLVFLLMLAPLLSFNTWMFTALHGMQTRSCNEISVRPSVCLSVKRVHCDKTEEKSVQIFIPCDI